MTRYIVLLNIIQPMAKHMILMSAETKGLLSPVVVTQPTATRSKILFGELCWTVVVVQISLWYQLSEVPMSNPWGMATAGHASRSFCVVGGAPLRCFSKMACPGPAKAAPVSLGRRQCPAPNQITLSYFSSPLPML